ncbi:MAG: hypothetical protein M9899_06425 [Bdellovibrionaceae bacterium]|nr:hypothetical protein [Pseudobdellovibrionaceae bacterium]
MLRSVFQKILGIILLIGLWGIVFEISAVVLTSKAWAKQPKASLGTEAAQTTFSPERAEEFAFVRLKDATQEDAVFNPEQYKDMDSVWVVFQKGCSTCHKVLKESSCYARKNKVAVIALGLYDTPSELLKDARQHGFKGPVVTSEEAVDVKFNLEVTPTTFVMHKNQLRKKFEAYVSCAKIKSALKKREY